MSTTPSSTVTTVSVVDPELTTRAMRTSEMYDLNLVDPTPVVYEVGKPIQISAKRYYFKNKTTNAKLTIVVEYPMYLNLGYSRTPISETRVSSTIDILPSTDMYITFTPDLIAAKTYSTRSDHELDTKIYMTVFPPSDVNPIYVPQPTFVVI